MSNYFKFLPKVSYLSQSVPDITIRAKVRDAVLQNVTDFYPYIVKDGERADIIATKYYGSPRYTWLIWYANDIFHPVTDWVMFTNAFQQYLFRKYGKPGQSSTEAMEAITDETWSSGYGPHHWELDDGTWVDEQTAFENNGTAVSIFTWENEKNEARRNIKVIDASFLSQIQEEMRTMFNDRR